MGWMQAMGDLPDVRIEEGPPPSYDVSGEAGSEWVYRAGQGSLSWSVAGSAAVSYTAAILACVSCIASFIGMKKVTEAVVIRLEMKGEQPAERSAASMFV